MKTAAGHVGNLRGPPRAIVEFRSGGAAVDVGPDLLGVGARAIVLAGHLLNSLVRNSEIGRERLFSRYQHDTNKNTNKSDGWDRTRTNGDEHRYARKSLFFKGFRALRGRLRTLWNGLKQPSWCPWPESNQHSLRNSILSRARLPVPPQGHSRPRGRKKPGAAKRADYNGRPKRVNPRGCDFLPPRQVLRRGIRR
jgi:hypothetical protein